MEPVAPALAWAVPPVAAVAWLLIRSGRSIWPTMALAMGPLAILALALATPRGAETLGAAAASGLGLAAGAALYGATAAFMFVTRGWPLLARHVSALYEQRRGVPLGAAVGLAVLVVAPGEELLWRGMVQEALGGRLGDVQGAAVAWGAYVAVNAVSGSVPIVLGAAVGGAAWAALALATGGVAAAILCHAVWTGLMIVLPPVFSRDVAP